MKGGGRGFITGGMWAQKNLADFVHEEGDKGPVGDGIGEDG
jgi:hypothetical protein